ncbi:MAG: putative Beta-lactamase [Acidimicrobiales bacterium]|jgi:CubicO group peptidase (beta-lactamase class C family)|nr:putative Beta-lactamase [Acidimicrobiales bacterium]
MTPPAALADLLARAGRDVEDGPLPSCQLAVARHGELLAFETIGDAPDGNATRYVTFSCTKGVFASAVWALMSDGKLDVGTRVVDIVPEFGTNGKDAVTVDHLLTMTAGFPRAPLGPPRWETRDGRLAAFAEWRLDWPPGSRCEYHASSANWVLAEVVERVAGVDYRVHLHERVLDAIAPGLRLGDAGPVAPIASAGAPPSAEEMEALTGVGGIELPEVADDHLLRFADPNVRALGHPAAGVVGTAADLALYYQALLDDRAGVFDPAVLADVTGAVRTGDLVDPVRGVVAQRTRGLMLAGDDGGATRRGFGRAMSRRAFGHDGAGGQVAWADPETGLSFAYLTNGLEANPVRMARRGVALSDRAAAFAAT